jgi:hypothetical protein
MSRIVLHLFWCQFVAGIVGLLVAKTEENANVKTLTATSFLLFVGYVGCFVD